jgi:hypothetical protein
VTDLGQHFAQLDEIETEDLWREIELRFEQDAERVTYPAPRRHRRLAIAGASAIFVGVLIGVAFLISSLQEEAPPVVTQPTSPSSPTSLPTPASTIPPETSTTVTTAVVTGYTGAFGWVEVTSPALTGSKRAMAVAQHEGSYFMVGSDGGEAAVWRSEDGLSWSQIADLNSQGPGDHTLKDVVSYRDGLVAVGESLVDEGDDYASEPLILISPDGVEWQQVDTGGDLVSAWITSVATRGDRLIAAGEGIWISDNGYDWKLSYELPSTHRAYGVAASERGIVVVGQSFSRISDGFIRWSADGEEWTTIPGRTLHPDGLNTLMYTVAATSDGFVAGGGGGEDDGWTSDGGLAASDAAVWVSEDGLAWDLVPREEGQLKGPFGEWTNGFADTGETLIAVGTEMKSDWQDAGGLVWESIDGGTTWERVGDPDALFSSSDGWNSIEDVLFHDGTLIAVGIRLDDAAGVWLGSPSAP